MCWEQRVHVAALERARRIDRAPAAGAIGEIDGRGRRTGCSIAPNDPKLRYSIVGLERCLAHDRFLLPGRGLPGQAERGEEKGREILGRDDCPRKLQL